MNKDLRFDLTSCVCPEQYDVFLNDKIVGYIRLRNGRLRVDCPDCGGETIYIKDFEDSWKGMFDNNEERMYYLNIAEKKILEWVERNHVQ